MALKVTFDGENRLIIGHYAKRFFGNNFPTGNEIVTNGNFSSNITSWTAQAVASPISWINNTSGNGSTGFLKFSLGVNSNWDRFYQSMAGITVNSTFIIEFWYLTSSGVTGNIGVATTNIITTMQYYIYHKYITPTNGIWKKERFVFTTNSLAIPIFTIVKSGLISTAGNYAYFDAITIKK